MQISKRIVSLVMVLIMVFSVASIATVSVSAAEAGTLVSNAINLVEGEWYTKYWTHQNYDLNCYNKIVVPARGYITFTAEKPFDDEGELCSYTFYLYSPDGKVVWACDTSPMTDSFNEFYEYKIGVAAGTYYMNVDPNFYVYSSSAPIDTDYKYTFTATDDWEVESNDDLSRATEITLGKTYNGVYCEEDYDTPYKDYFTFKLTKGKEYTLTIYNYNELEAGTLIIDMFDPDGNEFDLYDRDKDVGNSKVWTFKANATGMYHFLLHNDGNEKPVEYQIKVDTVGGDDEEASSSKKPGQVKKLKTSSVKSTSVKLSWAKVSGADKYTVYYSTDGKKWTKKTTTKTSYTVKKLKAGTQYKFKVVASKGSKNGKASSVVTTLTKPAAVTLKSVKSSKTKTAVVKWETVKGVTGYKVVYSTSKKFTSKTTKTATVKKYKTVKTTLKKLKKGKKYYVKVRAYKVFNNKNVYGGYSAVKSVKVK